MERDVYTTQDIATMLSCGKATAYKLMREIKAVSDTLRIKGIVHKQDYQRFLESRVGKSK